MAKTFTLIILCLLIFTVAADAQSTGRKPRSKKPQAPAKAAPPKTVEAPKTVQSEPFEKASVETMKGQCVKLETDAGIIELEMLPEVAPETVRNFLNLIAVKAFDTTSFSRVVPGFIIQGGDLATREKLTPELSKRSLRTIPDEPNSIKHVRGVVSMARSSIPNSTTTHFFILLRESTNLDGSFAAFGRVIKGMEVVEEINKMPVEGEKPIKPVRLTKAAVIPCAAITNP